MAEDFQANNWWKTSKSTGGGGGGDGAPFSWIGGAASQLSSPSMDWGQTLLCSSSSSGRDENSFQVMLQEDLNSSSQLKDMNHPFFFENSIISSGDNFPLSSSSSSSIIHGLIEPDYQHSQFINNNNTSFWNASASSQPFDLPIKSSSEPAMKKIRVETSSTLPTFKVRKEKLGDRITALQQLVSPFGKTDTASVLHEAIEYIKFLHEQVNVLSTPYLKNGHPMQQQQQQSSEKFKDGEWKKKDLRSRGLCLVPISSTYPVATETTADFWTPTFGGTYR